MKTKDLHILRTSDCPAFLLEVAFLSNENNRNFVSIADVQREVASKILKN